MWWVVNEPTGYGGRVVHFTHYVVVQSATRPPNTIAGPFATQAEAQAFQTSANTAGNSPGSAVGGATNAVVQATGLTAIGDFFHRLTEAQTWVRVGEFVTGGILIFVGVKAFFPQVTQTITNTAKKAGKAVPFL